MLPLMTSVVVVGGIKRGEGEGGREKGRVVVVGGREEGRARARRKEG
jgi:hypothetical protein